MAENSNVTDQATQAENMGSEAQGMDQEEKGTEQKLFTQEEVNSFVQARVARLKNQATKEAQAEYSKKLQELQAREMKLLVKERLSERGMPKELADIITCADDKDVDAKLDALQKIYGSGAVAKKEEAAHSGFVAIGSGYSGGHIEHVDPVRSAMGLK